MLPESAPSAPGTMRLSLLRPKAGQGTKVLLARSDQREQLEEIQLPREGECEMAASTRASPAGPEAERGEGETEPVEEGATVVAGGVTDVAKQSKVGRGKGRKHAMTGAQRNAKYREKQLMKDAVAFKEKHAKEQKKSVASWTDARKESAREKDRERKAEKRQELKMSKMKPQDKYKTNAALAKATMKVSKALPEDPKRAQEVIYSLNRKLEKEVGPVEIVEEENSKVMNTRIKDRNKVVNFYFKPDISLTFPGRKDYVMVKGKDGKRSKMTKHVLSLTLREAHSEFSKDEKDISISLDTFTRLRPPNVLLRHNMPKNVCVCKYHENINFLIEPLHCHEEDFPSNHRELILATTCQQDSTEAEHCQTGHCETCQGLCTFEHLLELLGCTLVVAKAWYMKYYQWEEE